MKAIVSEPSAVYETPQWKVKNVTNNRFNLTESNDLTIGYRRPKITSFISLEKPKKKFDVTQLRGKMSKVSAEEIDKQIDELRNEWDRGF